MPALVQIACHGGSAITMLSAKLCWGWGDAVAWTNAPAMVYHGTTYTQAAQIVAHGVDPAKGRTAADFGQGFYVTTVLGQAQEWANQKARTAGGNERAAVLVFNIDRDLMGARGDHLVFLVPSPAFYEFVLFNRLDNPRHGRGLKAPYDVVYGPVSLYPQKNLTISRCDQICITAGSASMDSAIVALGKPNPDTFVGDPLFDPVFV